MSVKKPSRLGLMNSSAEERKERSSETDSVGTSDASRPMSVTGIPSICITTQTQRNIAKHVKLVTRYEFWKRLTFICLMTNNILLLGFVDK